MKKKILSLIISSILVIGGGTSVLLHANNEKAPSEITEVNDLSKDSSEDIDIASSDSQIATQESNEQTKNNKTASEVNTVNDNISSEKSRAVEPNTYPLNNKETQQPNINKGQAPTKEPNKAPAKAPTQSPTKAPTQASTVGSSSGSNNNATSKPISKPNNTVSGMPSIPQNHNVEFLAQVENEILNLCNNERAKAGLKPLSMDETMRKAARYKAEEMLQYGYFDHNSPYTGSPFQLLQKFHVSYNTAGENIQSSTGAGRASVTAQSIVNRWMNSPGHRANILNGNFGRMGIGVAFSSDGNLAYESQLFAN